ncbi:Inositolphosphorylceramide synthase subunit Kei1-domain-containing protein [Mariannaea sp. PMI_226]|nr:Inositolphosphorylceramide synthase subunit Kei1-domain-containing protein [Mariannaea sp. PMI_226]
MSRFTSLYLRAPRPKSLFGFIGLQTGTEVISLALVLNKVTGVYGLLAILTGFQLSILQLTTYVYSIGVLVLLVTLIPHIRRQSPFECLSLAWVYILDTAINMACTAAFGLDWYFSNQTTDSLQTQPTDLPYMATEDATQNLRRDTAPHGQVVPQETAFSMLLITASMLIRIYFSFVVMAYAKQVLQKYMQLMILEGPGVDEHDGPFAEDLPDGEGRKGRLGRLMVSWGRSYWLDQHGTAEWARTADPNKPGSLGTLSGEV